MWSPGKARREREESERLVAEQKAALEAKRAQRAWTPALTGIQDGTWPPKNMGQGAMRGPIIPDSRTVAPPVHGGYATGPSRHLSDIKAKQDEPKRTFTGDMLFDYDRLVMRRSPLIEVTATGDRLEVKVNRAKARDLVHVATHPRVAKMRFERRFAAKLTERQRLKDTALLM